MTSTNNIQLYKNDIPKDLKLSGDIAIDTETMGLVHHRDRLCAVQIADEEKNIVVVQFDKHINSAPNLKMLLEDDKNIKIMHFARFDMATLDFYLNIKLNNIFCTKIASKLVRTYTDSHGLKELCRELLSVQLSKVQQSSDWGSQQLTKDQLIYCTNDVLYLHQLRDILSSMLIREERMELAQACFNFIRTRAELDLAGWENCDIFSHN